MQLGVCIQPVLHLRGSIWEMTRMPTKHLQYSTVAMLTFGFILLGFFAQLIHPVFASGGSIEMANYYPEDGATYTAIDHFLEQTTAINTNTSVSVSIEGAPPIPMTYQGIRNEIVPGDTEARNWHTWQIQIPPITAPGRYTFRFFSHYYVWQNADQYWAEFTSYSNVQSFEIGSSLPALSQSPNSVSPSGSSNQPLVANSESPSTASNPRPSPSPSQDNWESFSFVAIEVFSAGALAVAVTVIVAVALKKKFGKWN